MGKICTILEKKGPLAIDQASISCEKKRGARRVSRENHLGHDILLATVPKLFGSLSYDCETFG